MRTFLLLGQTGVGKSSLINSTFGVSVAETSDTEVCTKVVKHYSYHTPFGDLCLIDTPGLGEGSEKLDEKYLETIKKFIFKEKVDVYVYVSLLNETRFRPTEKRTLKLLTEYLGTSIWEKAWLILTFAASVQAEKLELAADIRVDQIWSFVEELNSYKNKFKGFDKILMGDNVVENWTVGNEPISKLLAAH